MDRRYLPWFGVVVVMATVLATTSDCARLTATRADEEDDYGANDGDYDGNGGDDANYEASHYHYSSDSQYDDAPSAGDGEAYEDAISVSEADDSEVAVEAKSAYSRSRATSSHKTKRVYVPVFVPQRQKKKMKIIAVDKGFYIPGGTQMYGRFLSLKQCMKACGDTPTCFSADYNPWLHKCYQHSNFTACNTRKSHPQFVHFSKVPCTIIDAPAGKVTLGASVSGGILQHGIDTITECIKKCVSAGGGVQPTVSIGAVDAANAFARQACFAIDFNFATHQCYFFGTNLWTVAFPSSTTGVTPMYDQIFFHCPVKVTGYQSLNAIPNPNVVHITFCPLPVG